MAGISDIPDWTWNEAGLNYEWSHPGPDTLATMFDKSPIKHIDSVTAPTLLMIGTLRVPTVHYNTNIQP